MIVNGVTLPDLPAELLASYPNAIITLAKNNTLGTETYAFWASSTEFIYLSQEVFPEAENTLSSLNDFMSAAYDEDGLAWKDESVIPAGTNLLLAVNAGLTTLDIIWSNHDIYEVASVNEETGEFTYGDIYFANSEEPKPTRVSIGRSLVNGFATQVQRLTGTTDQMNAVQIREKLSAVKAGIKIGDTVLPPIPEDVLAEYPYAVICTNDSVHTLAFSRKEWCRVDNSLTGVGFAMLYGQETARIYELSNSAWIENTTDEFIYLNLSKAYPEWSNHNIYKAAAFNKETYEVTIGTELYYTERENLNGLWLPKLPEGIFDTNSYGYIIEILLTDEDKPRYYLLNNSAELLYGTVELWATLGLTPESGYIGSEGGVLAVGEGDVIRFCGGLSGVWQEGSSFLVPCPIGETSAGTFRLAWANHDVYECIDANAETMEFTKGSLYFPPLPTIDTDRVSIGYDLCDGIVEEVQRLSGETGQMNALRAYWKLTTVEVS